MIQHLLIRHTRPSSCISKPYLTSCVQTWQIRRASTQKLQRRDDIWIPTVSLKRHDESLDATQLLIRAGYLRQAYSGIYHMLPLGLRVQDKLERLIDKHMQSIDASKVSLSSISSQSLWQKSGRLTIGSELFKFSDRKDAKWLLAPTHEEEITTLVADTVHSPSQLPIRLYQISRKYRDEKRPRGGLLRGREFIMKDLYTFDATQSEAYATYDSVRNAYRNFLNELKIRYVEARADSGNMGGNLSHEYHFPSPAGEDDVISCGSCGHARNEEWVPDCSYTTQSISLEQETDNHETAELLQVTTSDFVGRKPTYLVKAYGPFKQVGNEVIGINPYAVKAALQDIVNIDTGAEEPRKVFADALSQPTSPEKGKVFYLFDPSITTKQAHAQIQQDAAWLVENDFSAEMIVANPNTNKSFSLMKQASGDSCPQCGNGTLTVDKAIEVGHTFHLGTRYSSKLDLTIKSSEKDSKPILVEMGCHGIGVSRLVAAVASSLSDNVGLNWPRLIAPFEAVLIVNGNDTERQQIATQVYSSLNEGDDLVDTLLDDRAGVSNVYKLKDADLIGYPIILVVGKSWQKSQEIEIQCRRLGIKENVGLDDVSSRVRELLTQL